MTKKYKIGDVVFVKDLASGHISKYMICVMRGAKFAFVSIDSSRQCSLEYDSVQELVDSLLKTVYEIIDVVPREEVLFVKKL